MAALTTLNTLTLGNTFGGWYARTNEMIQRLNLLKTASITGGDGILVKENSALGGFTAEISDTIAKNVTFQGNLTVLGSLNAAFSQDVSGINVILPYNSGVTLGNIVYLDSSGLLEKAKADDECTAEVVGVVIGFTGGYAQVATSGRISGSNIIGNFLNSAGATLQKGVVYFLSEGVTGAGTTLEPSVVDYVSKPVLLGLTGDTGLILPYRGFIATYGLSGGSSTTTVPGVSAGVSSLNKLKNYPFNSSTGEFLTSGDLTSVLLIGAYGGNEVSRDILLDYKVETPQNNQFSNVVSGLITQRSSITQNGDYSETTLNVSTMTTNTFEIFSTNGSTFDVWRLKNIKASVLTPPVKPILFVLGRTFNRLSCTSYINNENKSTNYSDPHPGLYFEIGSKQITVTISGALTVGGGAINNPINTKTILKAKESTLYSALEGAAIDGVTTSIIGNGGNAYTRVEPSTGGGYPLIYGTGLHTNTGPFASFYKRAIGNRVYSWEFTGVTFGSSTVSAPEHQISKALDALIYSQDIDMSSASPSGAVLDTSILGWNSYYGGLPESLWITVKGVHLGAFDSGNVNPDPYNIVFYFEMSKYDINTGQESMTNIIRIPVENCIQKHTISGWGPLTF